MQRRVKIMDRLSDIQVSRCLPPNRHFLEASKSMVWGMYSSSVISASTCLFSPGKFDQLCDIF